MTETFEDFFTALLYGGGAWIGLLIIVSIVVMLTLAWKYSIVLLIPITLFMGVAYLTHDLIWHSIIMFTYVIFALYYASKELK